MKQQPLSEHWHVLGAGALGGLWAARLSQLVPVGLLARAPASGLRQIRLTDGQSTQRLELPVEATTAQGPAIRHLLVATKSYDTPTAIKAIAHRLSPETSLYLMQNGLGSQETVAEQFSQQAIYAVTTTEGANRRDPDEIVHAGRGQTWIGPFNSRANLQHADRVAGLFTRAGFSTAASGEIRRQLWFKLAINCAINPFTAILNCPNGELPQHPFFRERLTPLCEELAGAMNQAEIETDAPELEQRVREVIAGTSANISSMLQDVRAGRRTEIDAINGYLVRFCQSQELPCPVSQELVALVSGLASV